MKSNTYYQLKFKHKVHHANTGSITYSILLGTEKADLSIDSIPAFTTPSSAIISDIEFYFKTKDNVLSNVDIWFAFQRAVLPNTANCWFDRMTLVEANNIAASGISGVSSGIYLSGSAFAPEITLGTGDMIDCTQFVVNPNFDKNNQGWTSTTEHKITNYQQVKLVFSLLLIGRTGMEVIFQERCIRLYRDCRWGNIKYR